MIDSTYDSLRTDGFGSLDIDSLMNNDEEILVKISIKEFLTKNFNITLDDIGNTVKIDLVHGYYIVNSRLKDIVVTNTSIDLLTNGLFKWGEVHYFICNNCKNLTTLEGTPLVCKRFFCENCKNLTSLKGAPKKCKYFCCGNCENLTSLKGAPKNCNVFICDECENLTSLEGAPEKCKYFYCDDCNSLKSLKYAPIECVDFSCRRTNIIDLEGLPDNLETLVCSECDNLISLKGCPKELKYLYALYCRNLTDKKYLPTNTKLSERN